MRLFLILISLLCPFQTSARTPKFAKVGDFPYEVAILKNNRFHCGGVLMDERIFVLTAAHCVEYKKLSEFIVIAGAVDEANIRIENKYAVSDIVKHPRYRKDTKDFDLAIVVLKRKVEKFNGDPVGMMSHFYHIEKGKPITMLYWDHSHGFRLTSILVKMWGPEDCTALNIYGPYDFNYPFPLTSETTFCITMPNNVCLTDDGGSAVVNHQLVGIASWNVNCSDTDLPLVLSNMAILSEWTERVIRNYYKID